MQNKNNHDVSSFLEQRDNLSLLKILTCGSVDDGKSTLIGRLLYESKSLLDSQMINLEKDSLKHGTQGKEIDFALLVDGLSAEREQGITIDVAYRYFFSKQRKFIIADAPGHEQYTRNMVTGASVSDLAIILVDADKGIKEQTRRHTYLVNLLGIKNVVLAVNKMDKSNFDQNLFHSICIEFENFIKDLKDLTVEKIPISALLGENLVKPSKKMQWYNGPSLLSYLETVEVKNKSDEPFRLPVQMVSRPNSDTRGYMGLIASGKVSIGDSVQIQSSNEICSVKEINIGNKSLRSASEGMSVYVSLDRDIDVSRGDIISSYFQPQKKSDHFEVDIAWLAEQQGFKGRRYIIKTSNEYVGASISEIKYQYNINTFEH